MTADRLFVCRQVAGELAIEQIGREVFLESGDITLLDPLVPYTGRFFSGSKLLVLKFPRRLLEARTGKTRQMIARRIRPTGAEFSIKLSSHAAGPCGQAGRRGGGDHRGAGARPGRRVVCEDAGRREAARFIRSVACIAEPSRCSGSAAPRPGS
jgi:AraC-binding-like domain